MPRKAAWMILRSGSATPLREVDAVAEGLGLEGRDRALLRRLVGTEIRRRGTLRALTAHFTRAKPKPDLAVLLHLGLVQAFFLDRVPDHALVNETVNLAFELCGPHEGRAANGALRSAIRAREAGVTGDPRRDLPLRKLHLAEPVFHDATEHPLLWAEEALSMPATLMKGWTKRYGEETARALALAALEEPPLSLRVVQGPREAVIGELTALGLHPREGIHPAIALVPAAETETALSSAPMREGRATVQGETALRAAEAVQAQPGESVLDLCAAPGGKTAVLASTGALVTACDVNQEKLGRLRSTLTRLALSDVVTCVVSDGSTQLDSALRFDAALVDAPCGNTGVLAQRPEARWRYGPKNQAELSALQARLLEEGAGRVREGGRLVWSTCSLQPEENARAVRTFLEGHSGWSLEEEREALPEVSQARDATPGPIDGGYFARLRRT
jgi:16S rRNA (cytosine967-C5)-methyltransferase